MHIDNAFTLIASHIEYQGYKLVPSREYYMNPLTKEVGYVRRSKPKIKIISLLHEYGHIVQSPCSLGLKNSKSRNKAFIVATEYNAWIEGKNLANHLGIIPDTITEEEYDDEMAKYWTMYFDTVVYESQKDIKYLVDIYKEGLAT